MYNPFFALKKLWRVWRRRRDYAPFITSTHMKETALELLYLIDIALRNGYCVRSELVYLQQMHKEIDSLLILMREKKFHRLAVEQRIQLYESLQLSQKKLLTFMQGIKMPTTRIQ